MPFVPDPPTTSGQFVPDQEEPGLLENAYENAKRVLNPKNIVAGAASQIKEGAYDLPLDLHQSLAQLVGGAATGKDPGQTPMGARLQGIAQSEEVQHPGQWAYKNPIDAAMQAASVAAPFMPEAGTIQSGLQEGATRASRLAQEQAVKSLEGAVGQVRQVGPEAAREIGQMALDKGIVSPFTPTTLGMERVLKGELGKAGEAISAGREAGDLAGGAPSASEMRSTIEAQLANKYGSGMRVGEGRTLKNALGEVGKIGQPEVGIGPAEGPSFVGNAEKATEMNKFAAKNKMLQPTGAFTDVANTLSHENNAALQKALTPEQWTAYQGALNDYSGLSDIQKFFSRGETREIAGRGQGLLTDIYKGVKDVIGHKALAAGADTVAKTLSSPAVAKALPTLVNAAKMGPTALETSHFMLQKHDPEYASATQGMGPATDQTPAPDTPDSIFGRVTSDPSLAPWTSLFQEAARRGPQAVIANHFSLMQRDPDYNQAILQKYGAPLP